MQLGKDDKQDAFPVLDPVAMLGTVPPWEKWTADKASYIPLPHMLPPISHVFQLPTRETAAQKAKAREQLEIEEHQSVNS